MDSTLCDMASLPMPQAPEARIPVDFPNRTADNSWTVDALAHSWRSLSAALAWHLPATARGAPADQLHIGCQLLLSRGEAEGTVHIRLADGAPSAERAAAGAQPHGSVDTMANTVTLAPAGVAGSGQAAAAAAATASRRSAQTAPGAAAAAAPGDGGAAPQLSAAVDRSGTLMIGAAVMRALMPRHSAAGGRRPDELTFLVASARQVGSLQLSRLDGADHVSHLQPWPILRSQSPIRSNR